MALGTDMRLFRKNQKLYYVAVDDRGTYYACKVTLKCIDKGVATLRFDTGYEEICNIQSRRICFTGYECSKLCAQLNEYRRHDS